MSILKKTLSLKMPKKYDTAIHYSIILLLISGFIAVVSTSVGESSNDSLIVLKTILKQVVFIVLSYFVMTNFARRYMASSRNDARKGTNHLRNLTLISGGVILAMLLLCLAYSGANGSKAWIYIGGISIQPSEFAKIYMVILCGQTANYFHTYLKKNHRDVKWWQYLLVPLLFGGAFAAIIMFLQNDFGSTMVLILMCAIMILIPTNPCLKTFQTVVKVSLVILGLIVAFFFFSSAGIGLIEKVGGYKAARIVNAANPFKNQYGSGYNIIYSLYAMARGGVMGMGFGRSEQKFGYLPEAETDFILAVTLEELGIGGFLIITCLYAVIIYRLYYWAKRARQAEGSRVILIGSAAYLAIHFIFNVGGVSGLIPLTGVPLLFISSGGSSMLAIMIILGVCQSVISHIRQQNASYVKQKREKGMI